jgi:hypothetical protein
MKTTKEREREKVERKRKEKKKKKRTNINERGFKESRGQQRPNIKVWWKYAVKS